MTVLIGYAAPDAAEEQQAVVADTTGEADQCLACITAQATRTAI